VDARRDDMLDERVLQRGEIGTFRCFLIRHVILVCEIRVEPPLIKTREEELPLRV
jgi:hypothetical protein